MTKRNLLFNCLALPFVAAISSCGSYVKEFLPNATAEVPFIAIDQIYKATAEIAVPRENFYEITLNLYFDRSLPGNQLLADKAAGRERFDS